MGVKGYKVFNPDWTCCPNGTPFRYEVGKTYEEDVVPKVCSIGFHFCEKASDCFNFYRFEPTNKVAEVLAIGDIDTDGVKSCTNKIQLIREISWYELLEIVNIGKGCTGLCNSGDRNSGNWNSGNCNSGDRNSGNWNSGDWNSGNWNSGNCNSGDRNSGNYNSGNCNSGDRNSGNYNSGNCNSGDWNKSSFSNGCFNTEIPKINMFNKPSNWTYFEWRKSDACNLVGKIDLNILKWILSDDMTAAEKEKHPDYKTTGGFLRKIDISEATTLWWRNLSNNDKQVIKSLPNFDAKIFSEITGIPKEEI